jgi:hypothetical protein
MMMRVKMVDEGGRAFGKLPIILYVEQAKGWGWWVRERWPDLDGPDTRMFRLTYKRAVRLYANRMAELHQSGMKVEQ